MQLLRWSLLSERSQSQNDKHRVSAFARSIQSSQIVETEYRGSCQGLKVGKSGLPFSGHSIRFSPVKGKEPWRLAAVCECV